MRSAHRIQAGVLAMIMFIVVLVGAIPHLDHLHYHENDQDHEHLAYHHHDLVDGTERSGLIQFILGLHTHSDRELVELEFMFSSNLHMENLLCIFYLEDPIDKDYIVDHFVSLFPDDEQTIEDANYYWSGGLRAPPAFSDL